MRTLEEIAERIELRKKKLEEGLRKIVKQLKELGAIKIVLFGSFASQNISPSTDLDILVVMPKTKSGKDWLREIYQKLERYVASDIIVFNLKEYEESKEENFLLREIEKRGRIIYEKELS